MRCSVLLSATRSVLNGLSQIFLQEHPACGLLVMGTLAVFAPQLLAGALAGMLGGTLSARWLSDSAADIEAGLYGYNSALLGMLIVQLLGLSPEALQLVLLLCPLSSLLQHQLLFVMRECGAPAVFTLPFVLLGGLTLVCTGIPETQVSNVPLIGSAGADAALRAISLGLGQVIFVDHPLAGLGVLLAVSMVNRRAACWALCGSAVGVYSALLINQGATQGLAGMAGAAGFDPALHSGLLVDQPGRSAAARAVPTTPGVRVNP